MIRPLLSILLFASSLLACTPLSARPLVDVAVIDRDDGRWLPQYPHRGESWVAGTPGHRYAVRLTNAGGARVLVVLSVDGVNAVSGEDADPAQAGYVLGPWQSTEVAGWRKSLDDIAQFEFTALPDSYAARTGRPDNVGVLGVAVFREQPTWREDEPDRVARNRAPQRESRSKSARGEASADAAAPSAATEAPDSLDGVAAQRIGTGHGQREWSPVGRTEFVRASRSPAQVTQLRYDTPERLVAMGLLPRRVWPAYRDPQTPQAFPGGFAADPPAWR